MTVIIVIGEIDTIEEIRRDEKAGDGSAHRFFVRQAALFTKLAIVSEYLVAFRLDEWPAVSARREFQQGIQMPWLGFLACLFHPSYLAIRTIEIVFDCFQDSRIGPGRRFIKILVPHPEDGVLRGEIIGSGPINRNA